MGETGMGKGGGVVVSEEGLENSEIAKQLKKSKFQRSVILAAQLARASPHVRQIYQDWIDQERWHYEALCLGANDDDLNQHDKMVKAMGRSSPIFSNRQVWRAGWQLVKNELAARESITPKDAKVWATKLWDLTMQRSPATVSQSLRILGTNAGWSGEYLALCFSHWKIKAKELWETNEQEKEKGQSRQLVGSSANRPKD